MVESHAGTITRYLKAIHEGDQVARERLWSAVYGELRRMAAGIMARSPPDHTLRPTALVNEAYLRLLGGEKLSRHRRAYFFGAVARAMRRILYEYDVKRIRRAARANIIHFPLDALTTRTDASARERLEAQNAALDSLAEQFPEAFDVIMDRWFCGLTVERTAELMGISATKVKRSSSFARAWLQREIERTLDRPT